MKFLFLLALIALVISQEKRFDDYAVIRLKFTCPKSFATFFEHFPEDQIDILSNDGGYALNLDLDILFTPKQVEKLSYMSFNKDLFFAKFEVLERNFQKVIDAEKNQIEASKTEQDFFKKYNNLAEIEAYITRLFSRHSSMVSKESIGKSLENREMTVYKIHSPGSYNNSKPALWINAMQHAREWITTPSAIYSIEQFLSKYNSDPQVKQILDKINIYYLPIVNPDGFVFTWTNNRMWRKNRRRNNGGTFGVDLNRNWRSGFGGQGSSGSPGSETYRGTAALSEPETSNISKFLTRHPQIKAGYDFHAYSQLMLRPWGKSTSPSPDENKLAALGGKMCDAIRSVHRVNYQNIRSSGLYPASGIMCDEFYEYHKQMGYTVELRPTQWGGGGFNPPPTQILPTAEENWKALLVLAEYVKTGNI